MPAKRRSKPDDLYLLKNVSDPQVSLDGRLVAYEVSWPYAQAAAVNGCLRRNG